MITNRQIFLSHLGQTSPSPLMIEIERAEGVYMYSPDGKKYMDLISGVSVSNTGHCHPKVVEAVKNQVDLYMHLMVYGEIIQSPQVKYAERLIEFLSPDLNSCYFVNSGSEAVEGALKLAKRFTGKSRIISFKNSYHGSTHGALSIQGSEFYRNAFRPLLPDIFQIDFNDEKSLSFIDNSTACVIVEPVQGEAGIIYPENDFLQKIRNRCDLTGALLIFDEIQTGFGRTGSMYPGYYSSCKSPWGRNATGSFSLFKPDNVFISFKPGAWSYNYFRRTSGLLCGRPGSVKCNSRRKAC
jgi:acetylornithine/N-succinyldiaminopimelate aminotransferase